MQKLREVAKASSATPSAHQSKEVTKPIGRVRMEKSTGSVTSSDSHAVLSETRVNQNALARMEAKHDATNARRDPIVRLVFQAIPALVKQVLSMTEQITQSHVAHEDLNEHALRYLTRNSVANDVTVIQAEATCLAKEEAP